MRVAFKAKISCSQWRNKGQGFGFERFSADPKLCLEVYQFFAYFHTKLIHTSTYVFPELQQHISQYYSFNNLNLLKMDFLRNKIMAEENKIK
jgi:hypothetical protein